MQAIGQTTDPAAYPRNRLPGAGHRFGPPAEGVRATMRGMSYDLEVYSPTALDADALAGLVTSTATLDVDATGERHVVVVRGARRRYSFTVDGPDHVEPEDVPADVSRVVLGARHLYLVTVEGSAGSEVPHAVRFARRLARELDGAVVDQQADEVWSRSKGRQVARPEREVRTDVVEVGWFCRREDLPSDVPRLVLEAARTHLPEAVPRRFGEYEPLQGRYDEVGPDGFATAWREATSLFFTTGSLPCLGLTLGAGPSERWPGRFWAMSATFLAEPFHSPAWRAALRGFVVAVADGLPAAYASAQVTRGHLWSGRSMWSDSETEWALRPYDREGWLGLPSTTPWWTWLGAPYADEAARVPRDLVTPTRAGLLIESATAPAPADDLPRLDQWLDADLVAPLLPTEPGRRPLPQGRAARVPDALA